MGIVTSASSLEMSLMISRGREPKKIADGVFPTLADWRDMGTVEQTRSAINLRKAIKERALWQIDLDALSPSLSNAQLKELQHPENGIANLTSGINGLARTWFKRHFGIERNDRTHTSISVIRSGDENSMIVKAFIVKHVPSGTKSIIDEAHRQCA